MLVHAVIISDPQKLLFGASVPGKIHTTFVARISAN